MRKKKRTFSLGETRKEKKVKGRQARIARVKVAGSLSFDMNVRSLNFICNDIHNY